MFLQYSFPETFAVKLVGKVVRFLLFVHSLFLQLRLLFLVDFQSLTNIINLVFLKLTLRLKLHDHTRLRFKE